MGRQIGLQRNVSRTNDLSLSIMRDKMYVIQGVYEQPGEMYIALLLRSTQTHLTIGTWVSGA
jgi:hypothetical protein